jgi:hypothetical protein
MSSVWRPSLAHLSKWNTQLRSRELTGARRKNQLQEIARASGGRAYAPENMIDLSATYDDRMENLKVRYVITYRSSNDGDLSIPRTVRVELVNPSNGEPLEIVDSNGKTIRAKVVVQESYVSKTASGG